MIVDQYANKFMELERVTPHLISTEEMLVERFQNRLQPHIHMQVACR